MDLTAYARSLASIHFGITPATTTITTTIGSTAMLSESDSLGLWSTARGHPSRSADFSIEIRGKQGEIPHYIPHFLSKKEFCGNPLEFTAKKAFSTFCACVP